MFWCEFCAEQVVGQVSVKSAYATNHVIKLKKKQDSFQHKAQWKNGKEMFLKNWSFKHDWNEFCILNTTEQIIVGSVQMPRYLLPFYGHRCVLVEKVAKRSSPTVFVLHDSSKSEQLLHSGL